MKEVKAIHRQAMEKADLALAAKLNGDSELALALSKEAYELEVEAANFFAGNLAAEPTRSVLYRSAASLALDCHQLAEAEKLIHTAMVGGPPFEIAEELRDLLEQVYFLRHLETRGISLHEDEIQMSIAGKAVGFGIAPTDTFLDRVEKTGDLLYRTAERKQKKPYRDAGRRQAKLEDALELYMTTPRAASFAVTFRVGKSEQLNLPGTSIAETVIDELLECLEIFARGDEAQLKERIPEEAYYRNFVALASSISPDGDDVNVVGFTTQRRGQLKKVAITSTSKLVLPSPTPVPKVQPPPPDPAIGEPRPVTISGVLKFADATHEGHDVIQIIDKQHIAHTIIVPPGLMGDIVKPLWDAAVTLTGSMSNGQITLVHARPMKSE